MSEEFTLANMIEELRLTYLERKGHIEVLEGQTRVPRSPEEMQSRHYRLRRLEATGRKFMELADAMTGGRG